MNHPDESLMILGIIDEFYNARRTEDADIWRLEVDSVLHHAIFVMAFEARRAGLPWREIADALVTHGEMAMREAKTEAPNPASSAEHLSFVGRARRRGLRTDPAPIACPRHRPQYSLVVVPVKSRVQPVRRSITRQNGAVQ